MKGTNKIEEIEISNLKIINTLGGNVFHILKSHESSFKSFGEAYFSSIDFGVIKGWKFHTEMTSNIVVPVGLIKFVFWDPDYIDEYRSETIGENRYSRLTIPPKIWFGFQGVSTNPSLLLNISNIEHDANEVIRKEIKEVNYKW